MSVRRSSGSLATRRLPLPICSSASPTSASRRSSRVAKAHDWDCTEFFQKAFPEFGYPIVATALEEMDMPRRDDETGEVVREKTA